MDSRKLSKEELLDMLEVDLGFIYETVVSTCDASGMPNAAPMGIRFVANEKSHVDKKILLQPFRSTTTYTNLMSRGEAVINVTSDPEIFYKSLLKEKVAKGDTLKNMFQIAKTVKPPRIKGCDAYIEVSVERSSSTNSNDGERAEILCEIRLVQVEKLAAKLYCRAPHALIETMIHATRVKELISKGSIKEANQLLELMDRYRNLIQRVAPGSQYETMANTVIKAYLTETRGETSPLSKKKRKAGEQVDKDQS